MAAEARTDLESKRNNVKARDFRARLYRLGESTATTETGKGNGETDCWAALCNALEWRGRGGGRPPSLKLLQSWARQPAA